MKYKNLIFLGTSHIARQSLREVKEIIEREQPDMLALELDSKRLAFLMSNEKRKIGISNIRRIGIKGFLFSLFGAWAEKKLGKLVGVAPGSEMKEAILIARKESIKIALVDQDIEITLKRLSKSLSWKEKLNFVIDIFKAMFSKGEKIEFDLSTVPSKKVIKKLTKKLKERYPNIYKTLVDERNAVIADNLRRLAELNEDKKILVILGAGHIEDVISLLKQEIGYKFTFQ